MIIGEKKGTRTIEQLYGLPGATLRPRRRGNILRMREQSCRFFQSHQAHTTTSAIHELLKIVNPLATSTVILSKKQERETGPG